jgi:hypothetical protein
VLGSSQGGTRWTATYFDFRNKRMVDRERGPERRLAGTGGGEVVVGGAK